MSQTDSGAIQVREQLRTARRASTEEKQEFFGRQLQSVGRLAWHVDAQIDLQSARRWPPPREAATAAARERTRASSRKGEWFHQESVSAQLESHEPAREPRRGRSEKALASEPRLAQLGENLPAIPGWES